jgi:UDP-N-acetylglucosamine transferase subunit ALG13
VDEIKELFNKVQQNMFIQDYSKAQTHMATLSKYYAYRFTTNMQDLDRQLDGLADKVEILEDEQE